MSTIFNISDKIKLENKKPLLLNTYGGVAAAYSLRKLDFIYSGSAVRVRRASDNAEQDIAFSNNELDTATLETFASGTDAFVTTWYDQSGNGNNATQTNASDQPKIVSSGSTILENGKAALSFTNGPYLVSTFSASINTTTASFVSKGSANAFIFDSKNTVNKNSVIFMPDGYNIRVYNNASLIYNDVSPNTFNTRYLISFVSDGLDSKLGVNGSFNNGTLNAATMNGVTLGSAATGLLPLNGTMQEAIIYGSNQSANLSGIETNINDYYSIY